MERIMHLRTLWFLLCLALFFPLYATSQTDSSGTISGKLLDARDAVIAGAQVEIRQLNGPVVQSRASDEEGRFEMTHLSYGRYELRIQHPGFREYREQVQVRDGSPISLQLRLSLSVAAENVTVNAQSSLITEVPTGQTQSSIGREEFKSTPANNIGEVLALIPGVTFIGGNGPRDTVLSIRGSNERQTFGVRNAQLFEDGFPVTQPDGLGRTDLTDPHAYSSVDVIQGPSSALYGNYATGGAINFHTRTGSQIQGLEVGSDFGSFGYFNDYATYGTGGENFQVSGFLSNVRGEQATAHNSYNTITGNLLASVRLTGRDQVTFKFINNDVDTDVSLRLSLTQYLLNPFQRGCEVYSSIAASNGCASVSLYSNGFNGTRTSLSAAQAGLGRHDRRTIVGARWEHELGGSSTWRTQFVFDNRDINQPTSSSSYRGTYPSFNVISDVVHRGSLEGRTATSYAGGFFNYENINSYVYNVMPGGRATLGGQTQTIFGKHLNSGFHLREELELAERVTLVAGFGAEYTSLNADSKTFAYPTSGSPATAPVHADRTFFNVAPEVSLQYLPSSAWRVHARFGVGYGTPQATQLFTTPQGTFGNNTQLKTQRNRGVDLGANWILSSKLEASVTGFYEWFRDEMVTQSAGVNLQSYTYNAPASEHRGVEAGVDWHPLPHSLSGLRLRASYLLDHQIYTDYNETLTTGSVSGSFSRNGKRIPGVIPHFLNTRLAYEQPIGVMRGFGGFLEANWRDAYRVDNANFLSAPGYTLLNMSLHYNPPFAKGTLSRLSFFFDVQNLADKTYVGSAGNITNSLNATTGTQNGASVLANATGAIYAGAPRASYGGVRVRF